MTVPPAEPDGRPYKGMQGYVPKSPPNNRLALGLERFFRVYERGSTFLGEIRAGCVLFMTSAYILFLNPLILSGGTSAFFTGMPATDIALATSVATGVGTLLMGVIANYPWVVSVQLGTNAYFVQNVLQLGKPCGAHATFKGSGEFANMPCECMVTEQGIVGINPPPSSPAWNQTSSTCLGTKIPYEMALACTFLEGLIFVLICFIGLREYILKLVPKSVLIAGAAGIGVFISFVGLKDSGIITGAPFPTAVGLNTAWPYVHGGWGAPGVKTGLGFNSCEMYFGGPPYSVVCPWLAVGGLIFTAILMVWNINGAFIIGIFFTTFISWMRFPNYLDDAKDPGLVPRKVADAPEFIATAGAIDFNWGEHKQDLIGAFFFFLYLDFIGSSITFVAMGEMMGLVDDQGNIPRSNMAFLADGAASLVGGLLGSSALTTYVESASAVREGGRTGITAIVCSLFFFASCFLSPLFSQIPAIATGPILILIGFLIFMSAINDINWHDMTEAAPAYATILGMPFTHNIAYGVIGGLITYVIVKFVAYSLSPEFPLYQNKWPGRALFNRWADISGRGMFCPIPGFNVNTGDKGAVVPWEPIWWDPSAVTAMRRYVFKTEPATDPAKSGNMYKVKDVEGQAAVSVGVAAPGDDSAHPKNME